MPFFLQHFQIKYIKLKLGDDMKIYLDLVFFINFIFDLLILLTVNIILKRNIRLKKIMLGSLIGGLSIFFLFLNINTITLFLLKIIISILMIIVTFGYKNKKYFLRNILYLYFTSIILGGFIYYLNIEFSYEVKGLVFINNGLSINFILLIILSPIILYLYIKQIKSLRINNNFYYQVSFNYLGKKYTYNAYLDTGNELYEPYTKSPVILLYDKKIKVDKPIYIPYKTLDNTGIIEGFKLKEIEINNRLIKRKVIIGLSKDKFKIDGIDLILNKEYLE